VNKPFTVYEKKCKKECVNVAGKGKGLRRLFQSYASAAAQAYAGAGGAYASASAGAFAGAGGHGDYGKGYHHIPSYGKGYATAVAHVPVPVCHDVSDHYL
jgi:hypothetical protein